MLLYQILASTINGGILKSHIKTNLKFLHQHEMENLNYQVYHVLYHMFNAVLSNH